LEREHRQSRFAAIRPFYFIKTNHQKEAGTLIPLIG
jgi:hypothetical protein